MLISAKGEFPRSIVPASAGYVLNGIISSGQIPGLTIGQDGAQLYLIVAPQQTGQSQNIREAQIITFSFSQGFKRLDTSAVATQGRDAQGVLISLDVAFETQDVDGKHTAQLGGVYTTGDSMPFQITSTSTAD